MPSTIRAFIALALPAEIKSILKTYQTPLKRGAGNSVKWVNPEIIHLTLKFLGNISDYQVEPITAAMQTATAGTHPFILRLQGVGAFPNMNRVQVIWAGLNGNLDVLLNLQKSLDANLANLNFPPERRPFSPHLTLGRVRESANLADIQNISKNLAALKIETGQQFEVKSLDLMQSQLLPGGPLYARLKSIEFS